MSKKTKDFHGKVEPESQLQFTLKRYINEEHKPAMVYCVRFCDINSDYYGYFASVGGNCASIYHIYENSYDPCNIQLTQGYLDEDTDEILYSCAWGATKHSPVILIVAGLRGILKCINCQTYEIESVLYGHGNAVNDLRIHPTNHCMILSASKDESIRLWNIETGVCIAVFCGEKGHRDEILCIDPHPVGNCFCSAGMDTSIKIWSLEDDIIKSTIDLSYKAPRRVGNLPFEPVVIQVPLFSTTQVHNDYVDSVRWYGNCIISKSTKNRIAMWLPDADRCKGAPLVLKEFVIVESNLWFVRMDLCIPLDILAVGNKDGRVFIYPISLETKEIEFRKTRRRRRSADELMLEGNGLFISKPNKREIQFDDVSKILKNDKDNYITDDASARSCEITEVFESDSPQDASVILSNPKSKSTVRQVAFHPYGKFVIYGCDDGSVSVWSITRSYTNKTE